jgi:hypothetical protein
MKGPLIPSDGRLLRLAPRPPADHALSEPTARYASVMPRFLPLIAVLALAAPLVASDALIKPGEGLAVIDTPHLHVLVPEKAAELLKPLIARAEVIYVAMAHDAGYTIERPLILLLTDDTDDHNGYSFVVPFPLVNIELAPAVATSSIFIGEGEFERTLVHELTHHLANDRNHGFRQVLERIFGRIVPNEYFGLVVFYLSTPAHMTMPIFWQEGLAQWAETAYAAPDTAWAGRGRDSLSHMVWRLDAEADAIPPAGEWRLSYQRWPFGQRAYLYGLAYLRYLDGAYGARASPWKLIETQARSWPFVFNRGSRGPLGKSHADLIAEARAALQTEQAAQLRQLHTQPVTTCKRLTEVDTRLGIPAWTADNRLFAALDPSCGLPAFVTVDAQGGTESTGPSAYAMGAARSLPDGSLVFSEADSDINPWTRSYVNIVTRSGQRVVLGERRLIQPDLANDWFMPKDPALPPTTDFQVAAIRLLPASRQELVVSIVSLVPRSWWFPKVEAGEWKVIATQDTPWSPAFRPRRAPPADGAAPVIELKGQELAWVETDRAGSRLVLAALTDPAQRTILAQVPGRLIHPAWSRDGRFVFVCADHSGVPNAYRIDPAKPGELVPVTNTVGGVIACVPSPDGKELAVIDHDRQGPFLARLANDPAAWPAAVPKLALAWPAPVAPVAAGGQAGAPAGGGAFKAELPADRGQPGALAVRPYHGLAEVRPLFWTPTTQPSPEGGNGTATGYGIAGLATDPVQTHEFVGGLGVGTNQAQPVGLAGWIYGGWPIDLAAVGWLAERTFDQQVIDLLLREYDYTERKTAGEARVGQGLTGFHRRYQVYLAAGLADYRTVDKAAREYAGQTIISLPPFVGTERYLEATVAYDSSILFPTSYAPEDGSTFAVSYRHSGLGGDLEGNRLLGLGSYVLSFWPSMGQQLVLGGAVGWSDGARYLQGQFAIGGPLGLGLPRGYYSTEVQGAHLVALSAAWRTPVWRPFHGFNTTPFAFRQLVVEPFFDAGKVSSNRPNGDGEWFRSAGLGLYGNWEISTMVLNPGLVWAKQLDGQRDSSLGLALNFAW